MLAQILHRYENLCAVASPTLFFLVYFQPRTQRFVKGVITSRTFL